MIKQIVTRTWVRIKSICNVILTNRMHNIVRLLGHKAAVIPFSVRFRVVNTGHSVKVNPMTVFSKLLIFYHWSIESILFHCDFLVDLKTTSFLDIFELNHPIGLLGFVNHCSFTTDHDFFAAGSNNALITFLDKPSSHMMATESDVKMTL